MEHELNAKKDGNRSIEHSEGTHDGNQEILNGSMNKQSTPGPGDDLTPGPGDDLTPGPGDDLTRGKMGCMLRVY